MLMEAGRQLVVLMFDIAYDGETKDSFTKMFIALTYGWHALVEDRTICGD